MPGTMSSAWSARGELAQGLSGLLLVLFVWAHMFFESSILLGKEAMYWVTGLFEGKHIFGQPYPWLVSFIAVIILLLVVMHAALAMNKFPAGFRQQRALYRHTGRMRHTDTSLWVVQAVSGFLLFFLIPVPLYTMIVEPANIGPYASADRVWSGRYWVLYALLLLTVHVHAAAGIYRLLMKWAPPRRGALINRARARRIALGAACFFILLGAASLIAYMKIGADHADRAGERYHPATAQAPLALKE